MNTSFAGRILILLSNIYSLGDRSGVNLKGSFNESNRTDWQGKEEWENEKSKSQEDTRGEDKNGDAKMEDKEVQDERLKKDPSPSSSSKPPLPDQNTLYHTLWSLQTFFSNPLLLTNTTSPQSLSEFKSSLQTVLAAFKQETKKEKEMQAKGDKEEREKEKERDRGRKRRLEEDGMDIVEEEFLGPSGRRRRDQGEEEHFFIPKYLTGRTIFELEVCQIDLSD
jgi:THO complex subunit 1